MFNSKNSFRELIDTSDLIYEGLYDCFYPFET